MPSPAFSCPQALWEGFLRPNLGLVEPGLPAALDGTQPYIRSIHLEQGKNRAEVVCSTRAVKEWYGCGRCAVFILVCWLGVQFLCMLQSAMLPMHGCGTALRCPAVLHSAVLGYAVLCCAALRCAALRCAAVLRSALLHCAVLCAAHVYTAYRLFTPQVSCRFTLSVFRPRGMLEYSGCPTDLIDAQA
jgi:hypothetical protein